MCDATTLDKVMIGSSAMQAVGNLVEGRQTKAYYGYKADQAIADAAYERGAATVRAGVVRKAGALQQAEARAGYAASGIDVSQGTPITTGQTIQRNVSQDALAELYTGERRARVLEADAQGYRAAGDRAISSSYLAAGRSLLSGTAAAMQARTAEDKWIRRRNQEFADRKRAEFALGGGFGDDQEF